MYNCEICNFSTNRLNDYNRHIETKKHLTNVEKNNIIKEVICSTKEKDFKCQTCGNIYKHKQSLHTHKKTCNKHSNMQELLIKQTQVLTQLQKQLLPTNVNSNSHNIINNIDNSINDNKIINNNKINVISYVSTNYTNTEPLKRLKADKISQMIIMKPEEQGNHSFCEFLVYNHDKKILDEFLGKIIVDTYKQKDPAEQQFWASDVARLTFIVRQRLNKTPTWLHDKCGNSITEHVISPFLDELNVMLVGHIRINVDILDEINISNVEIEKLSNQIMSSREIILEISNKQLHKQILRFISPQFQLGANLLE